MSPQLSTNADNFFNVIARINIVGGGETQEDAAKLLGLSPKALSLRKSRGAIPEKELRLFALSKGVSYQWLLTGKSEEDLDDLFRKAMEAWLKDPGGTLEENIAYLACASGLGVEFIKAILSGRICVSQKVQSEIAGSFDQPLREFINQGRDILRGRAEILFAPREELNLEPSEIDGLLVRARAVLASNDHILREALKSNIIAFYKSIEDRRHFASTIQAQNARLEALEKKINEGPAKQKTGTEGEI